MIKCLDPFGFGPTLIRWVETFYNVITSCVLTGAIIGDLNNGIFTPYLNYREELDKETCCHHIYLLLLPKF